MLEEYISSDGEEAIRIQTVPQTNRNWQAYWVIFSLLFTLDALSHPVLGALLPRPFYLSLVFSTVAWLGRAGATNAAIMFRTTVVPAFTAIEGGVEKCTHLVMTRLDRATGEAIVGFNCLIAPYARHLEAVATATNRQLQERERRTWRRRRTDILRM